MFIRLSAFVAVLLALCLTGVADASAGAGSAPSASAAKSKKCKKPKPKASAAAKKCKKPAKKPAKTPPKKPTPPPPPPPPTETPQQVAQRATAMLNGGRFTRFAAGFDQRIHLCTNGRFIYDTVSGGGEGTEPQVNRTEGAWSVDSASSSGNVITARVRGLPDGGAPPLVVTFRYDGRTLTVDGNLWIAERSDLCT
jgi:outer membrane biosynthesis protein TonB